MKSSDAIWQLEEYGYELPEDLIAQYPLKKRDAARLMVVNRRTQEIIHDVFANVGKYLPTRSMLVLNDTKVIHARLFGIKPRSGGKVEIFLLKKLGDGYFYETLLRPLSKIKPNDKIIFNGGDLVAEIFDREKRIVRFNKKDVASYLKRVGHIPLPPYIKREDNKLDQKYYQTIFANQPGSVAAPTAGLHFTKSLLNQIQKHGHKIKKVTLHINYGTFKAVEAKDIRQHQMHEEEYELTNEVYSDLKQAKNEGRPLVAVGTTSCRVLETVAQRNKMQGCTNIFIYPGCDFKMTDILITNFHLPYSTLLMLVYAFGGVDLMRRAYQEAIKNKYRFYSYGDAMIIL